jgi:dephospho-CoA kinase
VFADAALRQKLEAILHPKIQALKSERCRALAERGEPLCCYEAPILVEVGLSDSLRPLVVVAASEATQVARAMARDGLSEAAVRARIRAQLPLDDKVKVADHVIDNDGTREQTRAAADRVLDAICGHFGIPPERYPRPD